MRLILILSSLLIFGCNPLKNFHEVDEGKFYRSAQLSGDEFEAAIQHLGIKTIINLRGESPKQWYQDEIEVARRHNVKHISIRMSAKRLPHRQDLIKLLDAYRDAERPILIHCQAGADRTGEAAFLYQVLYQNKTEEEALKMQSPRYFHFEMKYPAKKYFTRDLWEGEEWARNFYDPCAQDYEHYDKSECP